MFSAMIWTVHFAYDNVGWPSFERAAQMINDTGWFIIGFHVVMPTYLEICPEMHPTTHTFCYWA